MSIKPIRQPVRASILAAAVVALAACAADRSVGPQSQSGSLTFTAGAAELFEQDVMSLQAVVRDSMGQPLPNAPIVWSVSDTTLASIGATGEVAAFRPGTIRVTARSGVLTRDTTITIRRLAVSVVSVLGLSDTLGAGDISIFGVRTQGNGGRVVLGRLVTLGSSNPAVAVIDPSGRVRAISAGETQISATVEGVVGQVRLVVSATPALLTLRSAEGQRLPALIGGDSIDVNGVVRFRETYIESGSLRLTGGPHPGYQTTLKFASYLVTRDGHGNRQLEPYTTRELNDHGSVQYDARGDLTMSSAALPGIGHEGTINASGFWLRYRASVDGAGAASYGFRREPL